MERRTWVTIGVSLIAYYLWMIWVAGNPGQPVDGDLTQPEPLAVSEIKPTERTVSDTTASAGTQTDSADVVAPPVQVPAKSLNLDLEGCGYQASYETKGGRLSGVSLNDYKDSLDTTPLWKWIYDSAVGNTSGAWLPYGEEPEQAEVVSSGALGLMAGAGEIEGPKGVGRVIESSKTRAASVITGSNGVQISSAVSVNEDCTLTYDVTWKNMNPTQFSGSLWVGVHDDLPIDSSYYKPTMRPIAFVDQDVETDPDLEDLAEEPEELEGPVAWIGLADNYFGMFVLPPPKVPGHAQFDSVRSLKENVEREYGARFFFDQALAVDESYSASFKVYVGPKNVEALKNIDPTLGEAVQLGFFGFFGKILLWILHFFQGFVGNWGLAIICMTVSVKLAFFPLTQMSFKSSQAMQELQPEVKLLKEKLKDTPEELNKEMMKLWKENGVNPLGGCLPTLIQFPVWIALYQVLLTSVDLYHTKFLYMKDLSSVDPYCVLPLIVVALMLVQQQMMPTGNMDPTQAKMMKLMPLMFGFFFFTFPAGLVVYIFVNMVLTILQQWIIKRNFKKPAAA